jgi:hypothetical protein
MRKKLLFFALVLLINISNSCKKTYEVAVADIVINELMPVNSTTVTDEYAEYDDWIELFNLSASTIDLSGYFLSDNKKELSKWQFPDGTEIAGNGYLIIWADGDSTQIGLHTNYKLSSTGEDVVLSDPDNTIIDKVSFPAQSQELSYSRNPNGTGAFNWKTPTYNKSNDPK